MIAGAGFALMAWREAQRRVRLDGGRGPADREYARLYPRIFEVSAEYYNILDSAWIGYASPAYPRGSTVRL